MPDTVVDIIKEKASTGTRRNGKIFIYDVREAIRIMTGEIAT